MLIISQIGATIGWALLDWRHSRRTHRAMRGFVARIVEGISGGNISITQAYVADLVEPKDRARAFGLIGAMFGAGMVFGPAGGGLLFARFGFAAPFLVAAGLQFLTLMLTIVMLPESRAKIDDEERVGLARFSRRFRKPRLARILWQKLALSLALYGWFAVFALYLARQLGFSLTQTDYLFSALRSSTSFVNARRGRHASRRDSAIARCRTSASALLVAAASRWCRSCTASLPLLALAMMLFAFGWR